MTKQTHIFIALCALGLSACSTQSNSPLLSTSYNSARSHASLEVPPDLINTTRQDLLTHAADNRALVLPPLDGVTLNHDGDKRWLTVNEDAEAVWAKLVNYVTTTKLPIAREDKTNGILETGWIGDSSTQTIVQKTINKYVSNLAGKAPLSDRYNFWLERSNNGTSVYVKHSVLRKTVAGGNSNNSLVETEWTAEDGDGYKEALKLRELANYLSGNESTEQLATVVLISESPVHILVQRDKETTEAAVLNAIADSNYRLLGKDDKRDLILIKEISRGGFFSKTGGFKAKLGLRITSIGETKSRLSVTSRRGKSLEREDALKVLYVLTGKLREAEL